MSVEEIVAAIGRDRGTAILRWHEEAVAREAMAAAVDGGFRHVEITLTTPGALALVAHFAADPRLTVGAGTVLTAEDARRAVDAGARFLVSPVFDTAVVETAAELGAAAIPGVFTATEMLAAFRAGAPLQKLFPAPGLGPAYVRACLGPLPFLRLVPTNGVDEENAGEWLAAGAFALGFVASLFVPDDLAGRRFDRIAARARRIRSQLG